MLNIPKVPKIWGFEKRTKSGEEIPESDAKNLFDDVGSDGDQFLRPGINFRSFPNFQKFISLLEQVRAASPWRFFFFLMWGLPGWIAQGCSPP